MGAERSPVCCWKLDQHAPDNLRLLHDSPSFTPAALTLDAYLNDQYGPQVTRIIWAMQTHAARTTRTHPCASTPAAGLHRRQNGRIDLTATAHRLDFAVASFLSVLPDPPNAFVVSDYSLSEHDQDPATIAMQIILRDHVVRWGATGETPGPLEDLVTACRGGKFDTKTAVCSIDCYIE